MRIAHRALVPLAAAALLATAAVPAAAASSGNGPELAAARAATVKYHDIDTALADGYALGSECVPGMGYHYVRGVADGQEGLDPLAPEILVYAPRPNGGLRLVAVEYASWTPAELYGQQFDPPTAPFGPPFYTLHAWVWQGNPDGVFTPFNPNISCPAH
ncbi:hypothetical protein [Ornithinicoccus halotolerans]|uniref:hypothetical protein n=1 Tax=Ornithinicoccus halotolerans TaxID=1748220 RepID=UPI00129548FD|nr:hypothetical protein [Ornithinicoccus halotolerans]